MERFFVNSDIYIATISHKHGVAKEGKYVSLISTIVETDQPEKGETLYRGR